MIDYALESNGGEIIREFTSKSLSVKTPTISLFKYPIFYAKLNPAIAIQPYMQPGNCFAYEGDSGVLSVKLAKEIIVQNVTIEHIAKDISMDGLSSAPKDFVIAGKKFVLKNIKN
jgi:hypothetical protein